MLDRIRPLLPLLVFSVFLFVIMPFVQYRAALDPELSARFIITALFCAAVCLYLLFVPGESINRLHLPVSVRLLILAQMTWMFITIAWSVNAGDAIAELLRIALLWMFFLLSIYFVSKGFQNIYVLMRVSLVALLVFTCYAVPQLYQLWIEKKESGEIFFVNLSIASTLSNKNFFAEVVVMLLPFYLFGAWTEKKWWRFLFLLAAILSLGWLALLQTLSTWLALIITGGVLIFSFFFFKPVQNLFSVNIAGFKKKRSMLIPVAMLIICILYLAAQSGNLRLVSVKLERAREYWNDKTLLDSTSKLNDNSVYERILMWRNSFSLIKDHPLSGAGLNDWKIEQAKYGVGGTTFLNSGFLHFEHPHNDYLLIWSEQGPLGILLYLLFFYLLILISIKAIRVSSEDKQKKLLLLMITGMLCFMVISFFGYPRSRIYVMLLLMLQSAIIIAVSNSVMAGGKTDFKPRRILFALFTVLCGVSAYTALKKIQGEVHIKQAQIAQLNKNYPRMYREAGKAESFFFPIDPMSTAPSWYMGMAKFYEGNVPAARENFEKAVLVNPYHVLALNDLGTCYEQNQEIEKAIDYYRKALSITPGFVQGLLNLSASYYNSKQPDSAFVVISRISESRLSSQDSKSLKTYRPAILYSLAARDSLNYDAVNERNNYLAFIDNDSMLEEIFGQSQRSEDQFLKILRKRFDSDFLKTQ